MMDLPALRTRLGTSTTLWAGADGVEVAETHWSALSGATSVDYNVVLCHGASGGADLERGLGQVADAGAPAIIMVAGAALGEVQPLVRAGWHCIGSVPFMALTLRREEGEPDPAVRRLAHEELPVARRLVGEVFDVPESMTEVALGDAALRTPGHEVWGLFAGDELACCAGIVTVEDAVVSWSVATAPHLRRHGHARRLLRAAHAAAAARGATTSLLYASAAGEPLYRGLGFAELERWQAWSRPRWVLGRL